MRWSLIPSCSSKQLKEMKLATFNARAETVATKLMSLAAAGGCVTGCVPLRLRA
jgi:putative SOS response-associated peptidase YedK